MRERPLQQIHRGRGTVYSSSWWLSLKWKTPLFERKKQIKIKWWSIPSNNLHFLWCMIFIMRNHRWPTSSCFKLPSENSAPPQRFGFLPQQNHGINYLSTGVWGESKIAYKSFRWLYPHWLQLLHVVSSRYSLSWLCLYMEDHAAHISIYLPISLDKVEQKVGPVISTVKRNLRCQTIRFVNSVDG